MHDSEYIMTILGGDTEYIMTILGGDTEYIMTILGGDIEYIVLNGATHCSFRKLFHRGS